MNRPKVNALLALAFCAALFAQSAAQQAATSAARADKAVMDKPVKDFKLKDVMKDLEDGEKEDAALVSLASFKGKKTVALYFMSDKCQVTWAYENRFGQLLEKYADNEDVVFLGVRSSAKDTPESIRKYCESKSIDIPVLNDTNNVAADYFNVRATPTFVVIDKKGVLRYFGSLDDNPEEDKVSKSYLVDALSAVMDGKEVKVKETRAFG